ncbi:flagellar biosynthetic protein FliO [Rhizobium alvei]|uniref:Flagellar biosynthetic protein FliO n=1 Tax=Rhizobium alvei TaxID=1132659 RepID=A0ABT8YJI7_9HYPH|nr:flagellar biosynthetic protein FliO [Rhizobium alvei]MDO6963815.1 flagellar biosynthetic protein FliO [Rhizobium alvei]
MLEGLDPNLASRLIMAVVIVAIALVALIVGLAILKRRNAHLFVKGGRSREHRLLVLDAAAVDSRRRLVLIQRDNVEHLIMIGGPTDIVIESGIVDRHAPAVASKAAEAPALAVSTALQPAAPVVARPVEPKPQQPAAARAVSEPVRTVAEPVADPVPAAKQAIRMEEERKPVSNMGAVLYGDDREPMAGQRAPQVPQAAATAQVPAAAQPRPAQQTPVVRAENVLDAARERVLAPPTAKPQSPEVRPSTPLKATTEEEAKALALRLETAKLEAARLEAARRAQTNVAPARQDPVMAKEPAAPSLQSEFEKLLEAELQAGGLVDGPDPLLSQRPAAGTDAPAGSRPAPHEPLTAKR